MRARHLILAATLAASLAACGGGGEPEAPATDQTASEQGAGEAAGEGTLGLADSDLGQILVDGEGITVYLFTNDSPGVSTCSGGCLAAWPPVPGPLSAGDGVDASLLSTVTATDGSTQASYGGWPLYYWAQDAAPGDVTGQGVNDVWFVVAPDGTAITGAPAVEDSGY